MSNKTMLTKENFEQKLLKAIPEFKKGYEKYRKDKVTFGLMYLFLGIHFNPFFELELKSKKFGVVKKILNFVEEALTNGDKYVQELVHVEFMENISELRLKSEEDFRLIENMLGKKSRTALDEILNWKPLGK